MKGSKIFNGNPSDFKNLLFFNNKEIGDKKDKVLSVNKGAT